MYYSYLTSFNDNYFLIILKCHSLWVQVINRDYGSRFDVLVVVSTILFIIKYIKIGDNLLINRETITLSIVVKRYSTSQQFIVWLWPSEAKFDSVWSSFDWKTRIEDMHKSNTYMSLDEPPFVIFLLLFVNCFNYSVYILYKQIFKKEKKIYNLYLNRSFFTFNLYSNV